MRPLLLSLILVCGCNAAAPVAVRVTAFTATWCEACQLDKPALQALADNGHSVTFVDADERPDLIKQYGIRSLPAYIVCVGGSCYRSVDVQEVVRLVRDPSK